MHADTRVARTRRSPNTHDLGSWPTFGSSAQALGAVTPEDVSNGGPVKLAEAEFDPDDVDNLALRSPGASELADPCIAVSVGLAPCLAGGGAPAGLGLGRMIEAKG